MSERSPGEVVPPSPEYVPMPPTRWIFQMPIVEPKCLVCENWYYIKRDGKIILTIRTKCLCVVDDLTKELSETEIFDMMGVD